MRNDTRSFERQFLLPWLCSAAVVTFIRLLHATDINYDTTLQIQAGQHLLEGKGLTVYWPTANDLAKPLTLEVLTQFPAGYSLYTAALTAIGIDERVLVKVAGAPVTIFGWLGWARLAFTYMSGGIGQSRIWRLIGVWIAVVSPVLFTSRWGGTDIFLWAAIPWILELITRPPRAQRAFANPLRSVCRSSYRRLRTDAVRQCLGGCIRSPGGRLAVQGANGARRETRIRTDGGHASGDRHSGIHQQPFRTQPLFCSWKHHDRLGPIFECSRQSI